MKSARHQLVLLGLVCQGLSWDDYVAPGLYALLWVACLAAPAGRLRLRPSFEAAALPLGVAAALVLARLTGQSAQFALGHGLALVQFARLLRPLSAREQRLSLVIALFHLGVACVVVQDLRFAGLLLAAAWLLPRALAEVQAEAFAAGAGGPDPVPAAPGQSAWRLPVRTQALVVGVMVVTFLGLPRGSYGSPFSRPAIRSGDQGTRLDSVLDPRRGAVARSRRILLQIQGERLGYLRCLALPEFDGQVWRAERRTGWRRIYGRDPLAGCLPRRVQVKYPALLARVVPTDGRVVRVRGTFFHSPVETVHGIVRAEDMGRRGSNTYEYWTNPAPGPQDLTAAQARWLTQHPAPSPELTRWLDETLGDSTDPYAAARRLEQHLRDTFTYTLGAPELSRDDALDDFVLRQRQGHCERFASALALLLRQRGVPTRVMVGYVPGRPNWISGRFDVRFRDAHAWTEAWFPGRGWEAFDATPRAALESPASSVADLWEAADFAWFAYVVNFDAPTQTALATRVAQALGSGAEWAARHLAWFGAAALAVVALAWAGRAVCRVRGARPAPVPDAQQRALALAAASYGRMLRLLAAHGHQRAPQQTPWEFVAALECAPAPALSEIRFITRVFCETRYGRRPLGGAEEAELERALERIAGTGAAPRTPQTPPARGLRNTR